MNVDLVLAPNPGVFTGPGTNTWIASSAGKGIVIDPGPMIDSHLAAVQEAVGDLDPIAVLVTHAHPDHAPAANPLAAALGVTAIGVGAGPGFRPDRTISDGERVVFGEAAAVCVATPGHTPDSVSFRVGDLLFSGDHIMGGSTVVVEDMGDYLDSLRRLQGVGLAAIHPGHGPVLVAPDEVVQQYLDHRLEREAQIVGSLGRGSATLGHIVTDVYSDIDPVLHPAAAVSVAAHLRKLRGEGRVECAEDLGWDSEVELV